MINSNRFQQLSNAKRIIIEKLIESEEICKALYYNDEDFESKESLSDPTILIYNKIFPYSFVPNPQSEKSSYITFTFDNYKLVSDTFKTGVIYLNAVVHRDLLKTNSGWLRSDYLISHIDRQINQIRGIGWGKLQFEGMQEFRLNENFYGHTISYRPYELN